MKPSVNLRMSKIRSKNSKIEVRTFTALDDLGLRFERHYAIDGKPDIAFPEIKLAVFIDSNFWHGWKLNEWENKLSPFWLSKIKKNKKRDLRVTRSLKSKGWKIIRVREDNIKKNFDGVLARIKSKVVECKEQLK